MPTWLVHGFKWPRPLVRIHIILQNLDDAAAEWLLAPPTKAALIENFTSLYPDIMVHLPSLTFVEQYDPEDLTTKSQPYAFVCDQVHEVQLSVDIDDVRGKGVANEAWGALVDLRDKLAPGEKVGWFVVVNGDVERYAPPPEGLFDASSYGSQISPVSERSSAIVEEDGETETVKADKVEESKRYSSSKGLKNWLKKRSKSSKDLREISIRPAPTSPPIPKSKAGIPQAVNVGNGKAPIR
jgi:hypothetical protein